MRPVLLSTITLISAALLASWDTALTLAVRLAASGPIVERIEAWKVISVLLGSALISCVILYIVVRFGNRGARP